MKKDENMKNASLKKWSCCVLLLLFSCLLFSCLFGGNKYPSINHTNVYHKLNYFPEPSVKFEWSNSSLKLGDSIGNDIAIDSEGSIYITGKEYNNSKGAYDVIIAKYDSSNSQLWERTWGGLSNDIGCSIAIDSTDNIYIVGRTESYGVGNFDVCVIKYNKSGHFQWNRTWGGSGYDSGYGTALDNGDNLYVAGYTESYGIFGDIILLKYNKTGHLKFNTTWGGADTDLAYALTITSLGDIYITGYTSSFGAVTQDLLLMKYNASLKVKYYTTWGGTLQDEGRDITSDSEGNIYIAGNTKNYGAGGNDIILLKFNISDDLEYNETWGGIGNDFAYGIAKDSLNNIYIVGSAENMGDVDGDICIVKFNDTSQYQWYKTRGDSLADIGFGITLDNSDNIYITGKIEKAGTGDDLTILKFSQRPDVFVLLVDTGAIDSDGNFTLSWQVSLDAQNYTLYQYHSPITKYNSSLIKLEVGSTNRTYSVKNLGEDTYYFAVVAFNKYGNTSSNCLKIIVQHVPQIFFLYDNDENPDTDGNVNLTWSASLGANNYSIYSSGIFIHNINNNGTLIVEGLTNQSYSISHLTNNIDYYYVVAAINDAGQAISNCCEVIVRRKSDVFTLTSDAEAPDDDGTFNLIWSKSEYCDNYTIFFSGSFINGIDGSVRSLFNFTPEFDWPTFRYEVIGKINGVYYYKVVAFNEYGNSTSECIPVRVRLSESSSGSSGKKDNSADFTLNPAAVQVIILIALMGLLGTTFILIKKLRGR